MDMVPFRLQSFWNPRIISRGYAVATLDEAILLKDACLKETGIGSWMHFPGSVGYDDPQ